MQTYQLKQYQINGQNQTINGSQIKKTYTSHEHLYHNMHDHNVEIKAL